MSHQHGIDAAGKIALEAEVATQQHGYGIGKQQQQGRQHLSLQTEMQQNHRGYDVSYANGLQGVDVYFQGGYIEREDIALHHHAKCKKDEEPTKHLTIGLRERKMSSSSTPHIARQCKRHGGSAHEKEEGHHEVPKAETVPRLMVEMVQYGMGRRSVHLVEKGPQHRLQKDEEEKVEASEDIERSQTSGF